ncbi:MAG: peptidylprolyl isomerase [Prevotella sp.]|nr:peptidylprolyl isomerase [Prevotella sp.]
MDAESNHKLITATYSLYAVGAGGETLIESAPADAPLRLVTGLGMVRPEALEGALSALSAGEEYSLVFAPEEAFGCRREELVTDISKAGFETDGVFDEARIRPGAVLNMRNQEGAVYRARVVSVGEAGVKMDFNHPLAGKTVRITGQIIDIHPATDEELASVRCGHKCCGGGGGCRKSGGACGKSGGGCGGGCGE